MEYITFYAINRTAFDILAYFWPELSGKYLHLNITRIYTWKLLVSTPFATESGWEPVDRDRLLSDMIWDAKYIFPPYYGRHM